MFCSAGRKLLYRIPRKWRKDFIFFSQNHNTPFRIGRYYIYRTAKHCSRTSDKHIIPPPKGCPFWQFRLACISSLRNMICSAGRKLLHGIRVRLTDVFPSFFRSQSIRPAVRTAAGLFSFLHKAITENRFCKKARHRQTNAGGIVMNSPCQYCSAILGISEYFLG